MVQVVLPGATLAESDGTMVSFDRRLGAVRRAVRPVASFATADVIAGIARALGQPIKSVDPCLIRADFASSLGIPAAAFEEARILGSTLPRKSVVPTLAAIRLDSIAGMANLFPYATLDTVFEKKLAECGIRSL
jgi:hypothetical protein